MFNVSVNRRGLHRTEKRTISVHNIAHMAQSTDPRVILRTVHSLPTSDRATNEYAPGSIGRHKSSLPRWLADLAWRQSSAPASRRAIN